MNDLTEHLRKELEMISNNNMDLRAENKELFAKYEKLRDTFNELLDVHLDMRDRFGFGEFFQDYKYDWLDKGGLLDE